MANITISTYKTNIMKLLVASDAIVKGIDSHLTDVSADDPITLIYNNIFPFYQIESIQTTTEAYIMLKVDQTSINRRSNSHVDIRLSFLVVSHNEHMRMPNRNETRIDYLAEELTKLFNNQSSKFGNGILRLVANEEFVLPNNSKFLCRELVFMTFDLAESICE